jgi:hypothetical protein
MAPGDCGDDDRSNLPAQAAVSGEGHDSKSPLPVIPNVARTLLLPMPNPLLMPISDQNAPRRGRNERRAARRFVPRHARRRSPG